MKEKTKILLLSFTLFSCSPYHGKYDNSEKGGIRCKEFRASIPQMSGCEKLRLYNSREVYKMSSRCSDALASDLESLTGIRSNADRGIAGYDYSSKKDFKEDIKKWSEALGCSK